MIAISKTIRDLRSEMVGLSVHCNCGDYPTEYQTYEEAWENLRQSLAYLKPKLGNERYVKLLDMAAQAKKHYDANEVNHASWLMQDMERMVKGKAPFAYPAQMYRW